MEWADRDITKEPSGGLGVGLILGAGVYYALLLLACFCRNITVLVASLVILRSFLWLVGFKEKCVWTYFVGMCVADVLAACLLAGGI